MMVSKIDSINSTKDRGKIVLMHVLMNLLSLTRYEKVTKENVEFDIDVRNVVNDDLMAFDQSKIPFDMLLRYHQQSQIDHVLRDEFDEWFIFFVSQCSWEYISKFCKYFAFAYFDHRLQMNLGLQLVASCDDGTGDNNNNMDDINDIDMGYIDININFNDKIVVRVTIVIVMMIHKHIHIIHILANVLKRCLNQV